MVSSPEPSVPEPDSTQEKTGKDRYTTMKVVSEADDGRRAV
jgi:hypothetical protein